MGNNYTMKLGYVVGLDLGQANDFTALTVAERTAEVVEDVKRPAQYAIRHLQRFKLGTPYPSQVDTVGKIMRALPAARNKPALIVDATGVGRPVVDLLRKSGLHPIAVTITGGVAENRSSEFQYSIPKRNLVSSLQVLLQSGRLQVARGLPEAETLVNELLNFKVKISAAGHDSYEAWRESVHDDLVLSAALALWWAERHGGGHRHANIDFMQR
jgi:hypothetical protein